MRHLSTAGKILFPFVFAYFANILIYAGNLTWNYADWANANPELAINLWTAKFFMLLEISLACIAICWFFAEDESNH